MPQVFPLFAPPQVPRQEGEGQEHRQPRAGRGAPVPRWCTASSGLMHFLSWGSSLQHSQASRSAGPRLTPASLRSFSGRRSRAGGGWGQQRPLCCTLSPPVWRGHWKCSWSALASGLRANFSLSPPPATHVTQQQRAGDKSWHAGDGGPVAPAQPQREGHPEKHPSSYHRPRSEPGRDFPCCLGTGSPERAHCRPAAGSAHTALPKLLA